MSALPREVYTGLVGIPFKYGGRGPDYYDCYGLVMELHSRQGITLPDYESPEDFKTISQIIHKEIELWEPCERQPGSVILIGGDRIHHHVATYIGFGRLIHTSESVGSVCIQNMKIWERSVVGYYSFKGKE